MEKLKAKQAKHARRKRRVRGKISGTATRPRMRVTRSDANIYVQIIDDVAGKTLCSASSLDSEFRSQDKKGSTVEGAQAVGEIVGKRAMDGGINEVVFDRGGNIYHGRVKSLADGARSAGIKF